MSIDPNGFKQRMENRSKASKLIHQEALKNKEKKAIINSVFNDQSLPDRSTNGVTQPSAPTLPFK